MMERYKIAEDQAQQVREWIRDRGGIKIWRSINLSNINTRWITPAREENGKDYVKPNWQCATPSTRTITDETEIAVLQSFEVKRFHVAVRRSGNGLNMKVSDGGTRRIRAAVAKAKEKYGDAWYEFDYGDYDNAIIMAAADAIPMEEWGVKS